MLDVTRAYGLDFLFPQNDTAVGASLRAAGEFARPEMEILSKLLADRGGTFIDVGANIGSMALPIAAANPSSQVIAIEANRQIAMILAANALGNRLLNVAVHHAAVGASLGLISFPSPDLGSTQNFGMLSASDERQRSLPHEQVRMLTLDEVAPEDTSLIKIDVEGFEDQVFAGARRLLDRSNVSWLVEYSTDSAASLENIRLFRSLGYRLFWLWAPFVTPAAKKKSDKSDRNGDYNFLALRRDQPPVPMTEVVDPSSPPNTLGAYPYLKDYGYRWG